MNRVIRAIISILIYTTSCIIYTSSAAAQDPNLLYSVLVSWKTAGSHEILAKKATAFKKLKTDETIVLSLGNLLGSTRIVTNDSGVRFSRVAARSGMDYVIPAAGEFIFGVNTFRMLSAYPGMPTFISANIVDETTRKNIVRPYTVLTVSGLRLCIIGMSDMNIVNESMDANAVGIDVLSFGEALDLISEDVRREFCDIVIVAGRLDRASVMSMASEYRFIDVFLTNNTAEGFADKETATKTIFISDKPVYIASERSDGLSRLAVRYQEGIETREFSDIILGDSYPPDEDVFESLNEILEDLTRQDREEQNIVKTGREVASILKDRFGVDVAVFERDCLYYYPVEDSLTLFDVRKVIKPERELTRITLKGSLLKSVWEKSREENDPALRLHFGGVTPEGKIDDIPIQDDREYTVVTTPFLAKGGYGYTEFRQAASQLPVAENMLGVVEKFLVEKDEKIRRAEKKKIWTVSMNLALGSNFNKTDVDSKKELYSSAPPKEYRDMKDLFSGFFEVSSWDDKFNITYKRHLFESRLRARYLRSGFRTEEGDISYKEGRDDLQLFNKYTYDIAGFKLKPFTAIDVYSEFYTPAGKHPITASARAGLSREIQSLWGMILEVGLDGTRNYLTNENTIGTTNKVMINKSFPAKGLFSTPTKLSIDAQMTWNPMARYNMAFFMRNNNRIEFQLWKKFNLTFHVKSYAYRNTVHRKISLGFIYDLTLNYKMDWNF